MTAPEAAESAPEQQEPAQPQEGEQQPETFSREYVEKLRKENGDFRTRAKEADKARLASLTDAERAVAEAEERGRTAVRTEYGARVARTEFDALAARRNPDYDTAGPLEYLNLARFVGEDGEVDSKEIAKAVERLIPAAAGGASPTTPSFDGGTRTTAPAGRSMNDLIRSAAGRS